jgi:transposase-like protein
MLDVAGSEGSVAISARGRGKPLSGALKARVAIAAIKGDKTAAEICSQHGVHSSQVSKWKKHVLDELPHILCSKSRRDADNTDLVAKLYQEIGRLTVELDWLKKRL